VANFLGASAALVVLGLVVAGCADTDAERSRVAVDLAPISALAASATQDADAMEAHASAMATAAASRPELDAWRADAEVIRANAASLRLLASWAAAIHHDPGARSGEFAELTRILGDGRNLQQLGETLIAHAGAMDAHVIAMRRQSVGDPAASAVVSQLTTDTAAMRRDGQAAIDRGKELQETARRLAQSLGQKLE
jgi:outer membrane murein-binding lipoprotein Lpp